MSFSITEENLAKSKRESIKTMLSLRFEGKSPFGGMATIMKRFDMPYSSESYISQTLKEIGRLLPQA
jgi:hypothetical protein